MIRKRLQYLANRTFITVLLAAIYTSLANAPALAESRPQSESLTVATAANFAPTLKKLAAQYEADAEGAVSIKIVSGSSGKLATQIRQGAPFDLFFSADEKAPAMLIDSGHADADSVFTYAIGRLVLATRHPAIEQPLQELLRGRFKRLAIANPELAPYGAAAMDTLRSLGVEQRSADKLVSGENIAQTFQFVASGNAELGLIALSQLQQFKAEKGRKLRHWLVPESLHQPIRQNAILVSSSDNPRSGNAARLFLRFVGSQPAKHIISANGYRTVEKIPFDAGTLPPVPGDSENGLTSQYSPDLGRSDTQLASRSSTR